MKPYALVLLLGAALTACATPAPQHPALTAAKPKPTAAAAAKGDPNRVICKTFEVTGSRVDSERVCRTAAQWARYDGDLNQAVGQALDQARRNGQMSHN